MIDVAASEFDLLSVVRALVGGERGAVDGLLRRARGGRDQISPGALDVAQDILAKGAVLALARRGGWRRARSLRGGSVVSGRLWDRYPAPAMVFSPFSFQLCRWLVESDLGGARWTPLAGTPRSAGDELCAYLALDLADAAGCQHALVTQPGIRASGLCWLGFFDRLAGHGGGALPDLDPLAGEHAFLIDALAPELSRRWVQVEHAKSRIVGSARMRELGAAQARVLDAWASAAERAGRRDLCRFAVDAAAELARSARPAFAWIEALEPGQTLAERSAARHAAAAFLRALDRMSRWARDARAVRFIDDGYDAAQLWLSIWECLGDDGHARLTAIADELSALRALEGDLA